MKSKKHQHLPKIDSYPSGVFIKTEDGYFYVVSTTKRHRFLNLRVLASWSPQRVIVAQESDPAVQKLKVVGKMRFRNGSLLHCQADGKMYLVSDSKVRHIVSPDVLPALGLTRQDAVWVSLDEIKIHEEGEPIG